MRGRAGGGVPKLRVRHGIGPEQRHIGYRSTLQLICGSVRIRKICVCHTELACLLIHQRNEIFGIWIDLFCEKTGSVVGAAKDN